jgi:tRNA(Ile)-lysidine synthase
MLFDLFSEALLAMRPFEASPHLAVAVSGGSDSRALVLLAHRWVQEQGGSVTALVVDHGVRPESLGEAEATCQWLQDKGIQAVLLPVTVSPQGNRQQNARHARYDAMTQWCRSNGVLHLLFGHHHDDQLETLLQRLIRGSGVDGLSAMAPVSYRADIRILRPLLGMSKNKLQAFLRDMNERWIEDASNASAAFLRNRLRSLTPVLAEEGLLPERLRETTLRLARTRHFIQQETAQFLARFGGLHPAGFGWLNATTLHEAPMEIGLRGLRQMLATVRGKDAMPRYHEVHRLYEAMREAGFAGATLHGCRVLPAPRLHRVFILREQHAQEERLPHDQDGRWDERFRVHASQTGLSLATLGAKGLKQVRQNMPNLSENLPAALLHALPSLWQLERCVSVPHIDYGAQRAETGVLLRFAPRKPLC